MTFLNVIVAHKRRLPLPDCKHRNLLLTTVMVKIYLKLDLAKIEKLFGSVQETSENLPFIERFKIVDEY